MALSTLALEADFGFCFYSPATHIPETTLAHLRRLVWERVALLSDLGALGDHDPIPPTFVTRHRPFLAKVAHAPPVRAVSPPDPAARAADALSFVGTLRVIIALARTASWAWFLRAETRFFEWRCHATKSEALVAHCMSAWTSDRAHLERLLASPSNQSDPLAPDGGLRTCLHDILRHERGEAIERELTVDTLLRPRRRRRRHRRRTTEGTGSGAESDLENHDGPDDEVSASDDNGDEDVDDESTSESDIGTTPSSRRGNGTESKHGTASSSSSSQSQSSTPRTPRTPPPPPSSQPNGTTHRRETPGWSRWHLQELVAALMHRPSFPATVYEFSWTTAMTTLASPDVVLLGGRIFVPPDHLPRALSPFFKLRLTALRAYESAWKSNAERRDRARVLSSLADVRHWLLRATATAAEKRTRQATELARAREELLLIESGMPTEFRQASDIEDAAHQGTFPLCIREQMAIFKTDHHLKNTQRRMLILFFLSNGIPATTVRSFFRSHSDLAPPRFASTFGTLIDYSLAPTRSTLPGESQSFPPKTAARPRLRYPEFSCAQIAQHGLCPFATASAPRPHGHHAVITAARVQSVLSARARTHGQTGTDQLRAVVDDVLRRTGNPTGRCREIAEVIARERPLDPITPATAYESAGVLRRPREYVAYMRSAIAALVLAVSAFPSEPTRLILEYLLSHARLGGFVNVPTTPIPEAVPFGKRRRTGEISISTD